MPPLWTPGKLLKEVNPASEEFFPAKPGFINGIS